jgi:hypothetical protein
MIALAILILYVSALTYLLTAFVIHILFDQR